MSIKNKLQLLDIQEITTKRQKVNGTREFKLPVCDPYGNAIHVASYKSGYVRRNRVGGYCDCWQLNKTKKSKRYVYLNDNETGRPVVMFALRNLILFIVSYFICYTFILSCCCQI